MESHSRLPGLLIIGFIAAMVIGGIAMGGKSKKKEPAKKPQPAAKQQQSASPFASAAKGGRVATIDTAETQRTVVVPACDTPVQATVTQALKGVAVPGATVLRLPSARQARTVVVPKCAGKSGESQTPSAAVVSAPSVAEKATGVKSTLVVDASTDARTVVLPPCAPPRAAAPDEALEAVRASRRILVAPPC